MLMIYIFYIKTKKINTKRNEIENVLNKNVSALWKWFVDSNLSIHSGEDKTKYILFSKTKRLSKLNIF